MGLPQIVDSARNFAVMVRVQGPDPRGMKMRNHAFHHYDSGQTTLQASGMLLPDTLYDAEVAKGVLDCKNGASMLVVTMASVVEPFLSVKPRGTLSQGRPELISRAQIGIMVEERVGAKKVMDKGAAPTWVEAQLLKLVNVPASAAAFQSLTESSSGPREHVWEIGWSLASHGKSPQSSMDITQRQIERESNTPTTIAVLGIPSFCKDLPNITTATSHRRGDLLLAVGSPFGALSPVHFINSISVGSIANCFPPNRSLGLLMADIRCLPGMEGGPVFGEHGHLIGILSRPLKHKTSGAEIQLVIPWKAIASACSDLLQEPQNAEKKIYDRGNLNAVGKAFISNSSGPLSYIQVEKAMASVCLISIDESLWASGVLLNKKGLILTNAHLLQPWGYGKTTVSSVRLEEHKTRSSALNKLGNSGSSVVDEQSIFYKGHNRNIRVRLDHVEPWIWCDAKPLYVCKGPLDIALLQLENVPDQLSPISMNFASPSLGSKAHVIGHGLLGPKCGFSPSVCSGVVAKVVNAKMPLSYKQHFALGTQYLPAMLETTAAVHPGASGGAVVNSDGEMIGLITSNTKYGGGTSIPHLNFSIPCAALMPIFMFSRDMKDVSLLQALNQQNEALSSVWALMPKPEAHGKKEVKGPRFAKFMEEGLDAKLGHSKRRSKL